MAFAAAALPFVTLAMSAAGAGVSAYGAMKQGQAQAQMYQYQSQVASANAQIMQRNAQTEYAVGEEKAMQSGIAGRERMGQIRAAIGASGVQVDSGSAAEVLSSQHMVENINQDIIRESAGRKAYDYQVQAYGDLTQAALDEMGAGQAAEAGEFKAASSLIGGATSVADKWMQYNKLGVL